MGSNSIGAFLRISTLRKRLRPLLSSRTSRVFEAGCGTGAVLAQLRPLFPEAQLAGIDIEEDLITRARRRLPQGSFQVADLTKLEGDGSYDLVLNVDVLEHIADYQAAVRAMASYLRLGGLLAIHTPNHVQRRLLPLRLLQEHYQDDHVREGFDLDDLCRDIEGEGLTVVHRERTVGAFGALLWEIDFVLRRLRPLNYLALPLLKFLARFDVASNSPRGNGLLIIAKKEVRS